MIPCRCIVYSVYISGIATTLKMKHAEARRGDLFVACLLPLRGRRCARWLGRQTFRVPACFGRDGVPRKDAECRARTSEEKSYHVHCRAEECDWDHGGQHGRVPLSMSCSLVRVATNRRAQDHDGGRWREEHHSLYLMATGLPYCSNSAKLSSALSPLTKKGRAVSTALHLVM